MSEPTRPLSAIPFDLEIEPERYELREGLPYRFAIERRGFLQLLGGSMPQEGGGVAFWAHVGGFAAGLLLTPIFRNPELLAEHRRVARFL